MKKRILLLIMAAVLLLNTAALAQAESADTRVFDYAELFSADEVETLRAAIIDFQENTGYDFAILITSENLGTTDYQQLADDFYVSKSLGLGMNDTAVLCYLDLYGDSYYYISVYGDLKNLMATEDIQYLIDQSLPYFTQGSFSDGFLWMMHILTEALTNIGSVNQTTRVFDYAEILSDEERTTLEAAIADFRTLSDRDFLFLSTYEEMEGNENGDYMMEFYKSHGFGSGEYRSGMMIYLDLFAGSYYIQNFGDMDSYVPQESLNLIMQQSNPLMAEGRVLDAALTVINAYSQYFQ